MACTGTLTFEKQAESTRVIWRFHIFVGIAVEEFLFDCLEDGSNKLLGNIGNKLLPTWRHLRINLSELFCMKHEPKGAWECSVRLMFKIGQETSEIPRGFPQLIQAYACTQSLPARSFTIHDSLIIVLFDATYPVQTNAPLRQNDKNVTDIIEAVSKERERERERTL